MSFNTFMIGACKGLNPLEDELYDDLGVLQFHGALYDHPPFGLGNYMKETVEYGLCVDELAIDICGEPTIVHVLGT